jgi:hypothetical protein
VHESLHAQNDETNGNIRFLQAHPLVSVDAMLKINTAVISAVFIRSMSICHKHSLRPESFVTSRCIVLLCTFLSEYALLNNSRTAANDFHAK